MTTRTIVDFLSELKENNNREWFAENKARYLSTKALFEQMISALIVEISKFDEAIKYVAVKDCVFRIYKDVRFSHDKTPYKTHYGAFIAVGGGRKSVQGGYYLHLEPGNSFIAAGAWSPPAEVLKAMRQSIYDNIDEFKEIIAHNDFKRYFGEFYQEGKLKTAPKGFPKDFEEIELLKLKHYMVEYPLTTTLLSEDNFIEKIAAIYKTAYPLNVFLNYNPNNNDLWKYYPL